MKIWVNLLLVTLLAITMLTAAGCGGGEEEPVNEVEPISGLIYSIEENAILVVGDINNVNIPRVEWFENGKRAVYFTLTEETVIEAEGEVVTVDQLARGQRVDVHHEGFLAESYPEQGGALKVVIIDGSAAGDFSIDSGRYIGQVETELIEIKISGTPDEAPAKSFRLTAEAARVVNKLALDVEEVILFRYLPDQESDGLIFDLERIIN
ncbi:MAG: DUF3221 domain-containing protein [Dethiobacteria bacterium]|nr:DUF3221 domain-containing protein [Dethiobacteria bacterium]